MAVSINGSGTITGVGNIESVPAADVDFTPSGNISSTTVQGALSDIAGNSGAAKVGYQPAGTGAVATTVQSALRETISVKNFGAVGDGVTDDAAAIQAAFDRASALGNARVVFPSGTYKINSTVYPKSNTVIDGQQSKILYKDQTSVVHLLNVDNVTIRDLRIDANGSAWTSDGIYVLPIMGSTDIAIINNEIYNGHGGGVNISQTPAVPLGTNKNYRILVEGNHIHHIGDTSQTEAWKYGNGVCVTLGQDIVIRNNVIHDIARVAGVNLEGQGQDNILIEGNIIYNITQQASAIGMFAFGVDVDSNNVVIRDNLLYDLSLDQYTGGPYIPPAIFIKSGGKGIRVEGNRIYNAKAQGIVVDRANDIILDGNIIQLSPKAGIQCATAVHAKVINNQVEVPNDGTNSTNARIYVQMPTDGFGTAVVTGNTITNAPFEAFNLNSYGSPFVFTGNTIVNCRLAGTLGTGVASFTAFYKSVIGNNTILDTIGNYGTRFVGFYDLSSAANAGATILPDGWKTTDETLVKYLLPASPVFLQSEFAILSGPPSAGYSQKGAIVWNKNASANGNAGWICTAAGTPGTWEQIGPTVKTGTWTCSVVGQTATATGYYTKVGDMVFVTVDFTCDTNVATTNASNVISGFPFTASAGGGGQNLNLWARNLNAVAGANGAPTVSASVGPTVVQVSGTNGIVRAISSSSTNPYYYENVFKNGSQFILTGCYRTA